MSDTLTVTGLIATTPRHITNSEGLEITSFRLASSQRRFDKATQRWLDASTNWYTVTAFRNLAVNAIASLNKGDRIVVVGRLRVRDWQTDDRTGTTVEIEAETLGHDLFWCTAEAKRVVVSNANAPVTAEATAE
jgi:single-strand DNA-binding protein